MIYAIVVGVILLLIGYLAPVPEPGGRILIVAGWILVAVGLVLLVVGLLQGPTYTDAALGYLLPAVTTHNVEYDNGMAAVASTI